MVPLPPLCTSSESENLQIVQIGSEAILQTGDKKGVKYLGFGDTLAGEISPSCRLSVRALEQHGWTVELRPPASKAKAKSAKRPSAKKLRELERVRRVKEPFLDMFVDALTKGDPDPSELAWHLQIP
eukprot:symbB.v1.2.041059.t1/scaffold7775.1/size9343/1